MHRTNTTNQLSFTRSGFVTYDFSTQTLQSAATKILVPNGSRWTSGLHWHEDHTEYLQVVQGVARVTLNKSTKNYTAADGIITVPRFARHEWGRTDAADADTEDLIVREWTDPADGQKEIFFRNLSSVISDSSANGPPNEVLLTTQLFVIFARLDNYPVLYSGPQALRPIATGIEWLFTHLVLLLATYFGKVLGFKPIYSEYTPSRLLKNSLDHNQRSQGKGRND